MDTQHVVITGDTVSVVAARHTSWDRQQSAVVADTTAAGLKFRSDRVILPHPMGGKRPHWEARSKRGWPHVPPRTGASPPRPIGQEARAIPDLLDLELSAASDWLFLAQKASQSLDDVSRVSCYSSTAQ